MVGLFCLYGRSLLPSLHTTMRIACLAARFIHVSFISFVYLFYFDLSTICIACLATRFTFPFFLVLYHNAHRPQGLALCRPREGGREREK